MRAVNAEARGLAGAVAFLTRVPVGRWIVLDGGDVARGGAFFPLVGAGVGAVVGGLADGLDHSLTAPLAATVGVAAGVALTGALHLDALADTADALGAWTRERALEIMRDHAIGAYGAAALTLALLAKVAALAALAVDGHALRFAVSAAAAGRAVPVVLSSVLPYARAGGGLGRVLDGGSRIRVVVAVALATGFCILLHALVLLGAAAAAAVVVAVAARLWLGGVTGDVLGASAELAELTALVVAVAAA